MAKGTTAGEKRVTVQRRYAPKTRTGCTTCKIRRVKCDELKPSCERCTSTGRKCDGYAGPPAASHQLQESPSTALCLDLCSDSLERQSFHFFRTRTVPCISGYFQDPLWDRLLLQLSQSEMAVRHAVNALGALHEQRQFRFSTGEEEDGVGPAIVPLGSEFVMQQYSKALQGLQLLLRSDKMPLDVVIACCLVLTHFEAMRESFVPAIVHVEHAIGILQAKTAFDARKIEPSLVRALLCLDIQAATYLNARMPGLSTYTAASDSILPASLHDLQQARDLVNAWTSRMYHFIRVDGDGYKFGEEVGDVPLEIIARSQHLAQIFASLDQLLWDHMHKPAVRLSTREQHGISVLRVRVKFNKILAACSVYAESTMYDAYHSEFEDILAICTYVMSSDEAEKRLISVSLDEGLLHPIFFVATHCRDTHIRHRALTALRHLTRPRTIWHAEAMYRTAQLCIELEESLCGKTAPSYLDIPEWQRIHSSGFEGWELQTVEANVTAHFRFRPNGMDGQWMDLKRKIEWGAEVPEGVSTLYALECSGMLLGGSQVLGDSVSVIKWYVF
ncbi:hypothetical protein LTR62_000402 [Meristemomyces frigidus]|uniref:Zn(2)-C6 fungal-type domain-containing protein n=1 Tax=Meristemomyces frigidus TaxID=1508187 RepID=A0AAN7THR6_9PEZI|nr:hypothetical protein LTR62_000402 [Meristemomyces frigidus]